MADLIRVAQRRLRIRSRGWGAPLEHQQSEGGHQSIRLPVPQIGALVPRSAVDPEPGYLHLVDHPLKQQLPLTLQLPALVPSAATDLATGHGEWVLALVPGPLSRCLSLLLLSCLHRSHPMS